MGVKDKLNEAAAAVNPDGVVIADMSPKWRSERCMREIQAICEKYGCILQISQDVVAVPLKLQEQPAEK